MTVADDTDDLVRASVQGLLRETPAAALPRRLVETGFAELLEESPVVALGGLFFEQGHECVATSALDLVAMRAAGRPLRSEYGVVYPTIAAGGTVASARGPDGTFDVRGTVLGGAGRVEELLVPFRAGDAVRLAVVPAAGVSVDEITGLDPAMRLRAVSGTAPGEDIGRLDWTACLALCRLALGYELLGAGTAMLDLAVEHVTSRRQFGRPIGSHQAVKHRLADVSVGISAAADLLDSLPPRPGYWAGAAAKAYAGAAALRAAAAAMQVCGAIAFTAEFPLHPFVRRAHLLDALLGSHDHLVVELGERIVAARDVPAVVRL